MNYTCICQKNFSTMKGLLLHQNQVDSSCNPAKHGSKPFILTKGILINH